MADPTALDDHGVGTDLRAGAAVVLAALAAKGESSVTAISHIERGYADFVPTLRHLGADIYLTEV